MFSSILIHGNVDLIWTSAALSAISLSVGCCQLMGLVYQCIITLGSARHENSSDCQYRYKVMDIQFVLDLELVEKRYTGFA